MDQSACENGKHVAQGACKIESCEISEEGTDLASDGRASHIACGALFVVNGGDGGAKMACK